MRQPDDWCETDVQIIQLTDEVNKQAEQIKLLQADNELLRKYMLFIAEETDNGTLSIAGANESANQALAATAKG